MSEHEHTEPEPDERGEEPSEADEPVEPPDADPDTLDEPP
jgi:hypothetical protein